MIDVEDIFDDESTDELEDEFTFKESESEAAELERELEQYVD